MDVFFGILGAIAEASDLVEAIQEGEALTSLVEGAEAVVAINDVRKAYKNRRESTSSTTTASTTSSTQSSSTTGSNTATTVSTTATASVIWSDTNLESKIGLSSVPEKHLVKCHSSELFLTDDVVQATHDLTYGSGERISTGSFGILKGYDDQGYMIIHWLVNEIGELSGTPSIYLKKCDQSKFFKVGDVVRAVYDLNYGTDNGFVPKGSNGTLKELEDGGSWTVNWWNGIIEVSTKQEYILKCDQSKFFKVDEVIKAKVNLTWPSGEAVSAGTFGTLIAWDMNNNTWEVKWWNENGTSGDELLVVSHTHLQKCHSTEYWLPDDVFKTTCNLTFGKLGTVPKGSLCKRV